ncbi:MAG: M42 family metallopeptidase [Peptococcaceae bacterium]|jgi:endoglucanase|nr:M42 family metallopeptidase [Peptococcaceae bacterium]
MLLKELTELNGVAGMEKPIREALIQALEPSGCAWRIDKIGNLITSRNTLSTAPRVMLSAHMDEVGLMITEIDADGTLKFRTVGVINPRLLVSKAVRLHETLNGVIGSKAIHLQKPAERKKDFTLEQLYIDIGANSKEEAAKQVKVGDYAYFATAFEPLGTGHYKAKALDDRVGCAILAEIMKKDYGFPLYGVFTVQEEIGLRGAQVAAYQVDPAFAVVLEGTAAADLLEDEESAWSTEVGQGPACSIIDSTTLYQPELVQYVKKIAEKNDIPLQFRRGSAGGNDAGKIHLNKSGVPTITLSVPCRYIHSPVSVMAEQDYRDCIRLTEAILRELPYAVMNRT